MIHALRSAPGAKASEADELQNTVLAAIQAGDYAGLIAKTEPFLKSDEKREDLENVRRELAKPPKKDKPNADGMHYLADRWPIAGSTFSIRAAMRSPSWRRPCASRYGEIWISGAIGGFGWGLRATGSDDPGRPSRTCPPSPRWRPTTRWP